MRKGFQESDIREGVRAGGAVTQALVIVRPAPVPEQVAYVAYLRVSWRIGYHLLQLHRYKGERIYRDLGRLVFMLQQDFGVCSPIQVYRAGCPALRRFRNLQPHDLRGSAPPASPTGDLHVASLSDADVGVGEPDGEEAEEE